MALFRSIIFTVCFFIATLIQFIIFTPFFFILSRDKVLKIVKFWAGSYDWLFRKIIGVNVVIEGIENLPPKGTPYIISCKHQSVWDTIAFLPILDDPTIILKKEILSVPFFSIFVKKMGMIAIDRKNPVEALRVIKTETKDRVAKNRQILIYPEGTRNQPGAEVKYRNGIAVLYKELNVPVVIIAHNAGLFWPTTSFIKHKGTLKCRILPPIAPNMDKKTFFKKLVDDTEQACNELLIECAQQPDCPPLPPSAVSYLATQGIEVNKK